MPSFEPNCSNFDLHVLTKKLSKDWNSSLQALLYKRSDCTIFLGPYSCPKVYYSVVHFHDFTLGWNRKHILIPQYKDASMKGQHLFTFATVSPMGHGRCGDLVANTPILPPFNLGTLTYPSIQTLRMWEFMVIEVLYVT